MPKTIICVCAIIAVTGCASFHADFERNNNGDVVTVDARGQGKVSSGDVTVECGKPSILDRVLDAMTLNAINREQ